MLAIIIILLLILTLITVGVYQKINNAVYQSQARLEGKTAIITGGTSGLGLIIAKDFAQRGARVIIACPFEEEGANARKEIIEMTNNQNVVFKHLDLSSLDSVREFAKDIIKSEKRLDILVNNAGVGIPGDFMTKDGINFIMQVNYYGHFLLILLLIHLLRKTGTQPDPARIINMSSITHRIASSDVDNYNRTGYWYKLRIYSNSKLSFVLLSRELSPGFAATRIYNSANKFLGFLAITLILLLAKTTFEGAQTAIYLGVDDAGKVSGEYFANCRKIKADSKGRNESSIRKSWEQSVKLVRLTSEELRQVNLLTSNTDFARMQSNLNIK